MSTPSADGGELQRVDSYQWPSGHVGHLTQSQQDALERFKSLCNEKGYYTPGDDKTSASHDDETLLRYLRARKFIPQEGFGQFKDTEDWRETNDLDRLYETIDIDEYERTRRLYPQWTGRRDKRGIPFYVYEIAQLDAKDITAYANDKDSKHSKGSPAPVSKTPRKMLRLFALYENLLRFVLPLCSVIPTRPNAETPISQSSNVVDMKGVGFRQLWNLRAHMQDASKLATAHYPETLDRIFVVGAPSFFPTVWGWAKKWFDPITVSKIFILSDADTLPTMSKYVDIENIPKKYGGKLEWTFGEMPSLEPDIANNLRWIEDVRQNGHSTLPIGPMKWQYDKNGDLVAVAVGTENGKPRSKFIAAIHPRSGVAKLALSPGRVEKSAVFAAPSNADTVAPTTAARKGENIANGFAGTAMSVDANLNLGKTANANVADTSRAGTYTVPVQHESEESPSGVNSPPTDERQGTSHTRFEQQASTHAHGQLADGTPEIRRDGQGTDHAVMEPRTIGQAPKETPLFREEEANPSIVEHAQQIAGHVYESAATIPNTIMGAVGLGGRKQGTEAAAEGSVDPRIEGMENVNVEEFLREKTMTQEVEKRQ